MPCLDLQVSKTQGGESGLPSMATGCIRDIHVPHPSGGEAVQIGCPADLSGNPRRNDGVFALCEWLVNWQAQGESKKISTELYQTNFLVTTTEKAFIPCFYTPLWARPGFGAEMDRRPGSLGLRVAQPSLQKPQNFPCPQFKQAVFYA